MSPAGGHMFYIGLYREKHEKIFLSETTRPRDLYQACSKMAPPEVSPGTWSAFSRYLYVSFKQNSGERFRATWPSCLNFNTDSRISLCSWAKYLRYIEGKYQGY